MILEKVTNYRHELVSERNIFNATLDDLTPKNKKYITKNIDRITARRDFLRINYMDGVTRTYIDMH